ncbi:hypothetical protein, partial [Gaetbulibacter sp. NE]|uniref:hypothetical protein n=1 Tax=Gaetbulibacter sp. NE TaxID=2982307 RepID=UPI0021D2DB39
MQRTAPKTSRRKAPVIEAFVRYAYDSGFPALQEWGLVGVWCLVCSVWCLVVSVWFLVFGFVVMCACSFLR